MNPWYGTVGFSGGSRRTRTSTSIIGRGFTVHGSSACPRSGDTRRTTSYQRTVPYRTVDRTVP
eukprot:scaffold74838_cov19-Prasinocladus_malaysianus.AAC.1